jgi:hypothetical protein
MFIAKSVLFNFFALFSIPLIFLASRLNLSTFPLIFSIRHRLRRFFPLMLNRPHDQSALLSTEP